MRDSEKLHPNADIRLMARVVAMVFDIEASEIFSDSKASRTVAARDVFSALLRSERGMSLGAVGAVLRRKRSSVSYAVAKMEDERDNPDADEMIRWLGTTFFERLRDLRADAESVLQGFAEGEKVEPD